MTKAYETALEAANKASASFRAAQAAYRSRQIGDSEFLAARAVYIEASNAFDAAYAAEQAMYAEDADGEDVKE